MIFVGFVAEKMPVYCDVIALLPALEINFDSVDCRALFIEEETSLLPLFILFKAYGGDYSNILRELLGTFPLMSFYFDFY